MAKLAVTVTFTVIFSFFLLSHARIPSNVNTKDKPESETYTIPSIDVLQTPNTDLETLGRIGVSVPLTEIKDISFRPIDRHFHHMHKMNGPFLIRLPRGHRCRYHNGKHMVGPREVVSYGNDMIISSGRKEGEGYDRMDRGRSQYSVKPFDKYTRHFEVNKEEMSNWKKFENMGHVEEGGLWNKVRKFVDGMF